MVTFKRQTWVDGGLPAITAEELNRIETALDDLLGPVYHRVPTLEDKVSSLETKTETTSNQVTSNTNAIATLSTETSTFINSFNNPGGSEHEVVTVVRLHEDGKTIQVDHERLNTTDILHDGSELKTHLDNVDQNIADLQNIATTTRENEHYFVASVTKASDGKFVVAYEQPSAGDIACEWASKDGTTDNTADALGDIQARIVELESETTDHEERIVQNRTDIDSNIERIAAIDTTVVADGKTRLEMIDNHETRISKNEEDIGTILSGEISLKWREF